MNNTVIPFNKNPDGNTWNKGGFPEGKKYNRFTCTLDGEIEFMMFHNGMSRAMILHNSAQIRELFLSFDTIITGQEKSKCTSLSFTQTEHFYGQIELYANYQTETGEVKQTSYYVDKLEFQRLYNSFLDALQLRAEILLKKGGEDVA